MLLKMSMSSIGMDGLSIIIILTTTVIKSTRVLGPQSIILKATVGILICLMSGTTS